MCGIAGIVGTQPEQSVRDNMLTRLVHRGPDHSGQWSSDQVWLGHCRLSIVDLSTRANQPMSTTDGQLTVVANGEIYNHLELRHSLEDNPHPFVSNSDNEVLLHLYHQSGLAFLPQVNGMFAFALWDQRRRRLLLARDRLGIKPLYYWRNDRSLIFASEIKAILAHPDVAAAIDPQGLKQYLLLENTLGEVTLFRDIRMLPPGWMLIWQNGRIDRRPYWQPGFSDDPVDDFGDACGEYRHNVQSSVKRHLMGDVPVATYLSSGFDSGIVTTIAANCSSQRLTTFTGGFAAGGWYDETLGAAAVAKAAGVENRVVTIGADHLVNCLDDLVCALDEPRMGPGALSQYVVARQAAQQYKVILTGHGGDEFFGGYPVFKFVAMLTESSSQRHHLIKQLARLRPNEWPHVVYFFINHLQRSDPTRLLPALFDPKQAGRALRPAVRQQLAAVPLVDDIVGTRLADESDAYRRLVLTYLQVYLPGLFVVEDKISMAHALESRTPLCDNALLDLSLRIPLGTKLFGNCLKAVPKSAMQPILPPVLYGMPKRGFPTPLSQWLRNPLKKWCHDRILGPDSTLPSIFKPEFLRRFFWGYMGSRRRHLRPLDEINTHRLWMLLCLESWLRGMRDRFGHRLEVG